MVRASELQVILASWNVASVFALLRFLRSVLKHGPRSLCIELTRLRGVVKAESFGSRDVP